VMTMIKQLRNSSKRNNTKNIVYGVFYIKDRGDELVALYSNHRDAEQHYNDTSYWMKIEEIEVQ
ncbi:hypothetical protein, partial [Cytobacillus praedii]|uniref:hypothetical protein n=1 Tax=Cytobacillus praedii TaxID=1742358 RepID=UPI001A9928B2